MTRFAELAARLNLLLPPLLSTQRSSWEQGVCAQALLECHRLFSEAEISPSSQQLHYDFPRWLHALAHDSLVRQAADGRLSVLLNGNGASDAGALDPACIGETLYWLCSWEASTSTAFPSPRGSTSSSLLEGVEKMLQYIIESCPRVPVNAGVDPSNAPPDHLLLSHRTDAVQIWSDSVYMLSPFLASAAVFRTLPPSKMHDIKVSGDYAPRALMRTALQQIVLAAQVLQAPTGEWSHIYDLDMRAFKRVAWWGVGNGWVCCGIVRVLWSLCPISTAGSPWMPADLDQLGLGKDGELLPLLLQIYDILLRTLRACLRHILPYSSLFRDVLDDPDSFVETNLAQMLAYTIYRLLDLHAHSSRFRALGLPVVAQDEVYSWEAHADAMRAAADGQTDEWGFVRDVCGSPTFDKPGTAAEGQAWGVLMEVARAQYLSHSMTAL
ncbi:hypothetical protein FKP32DRAFT_1442076 [Trametes sanguinea]|nr:hypothetical protein FKP32DRAFT_1442076 [Trametes sanguinea]